MTQPTVGGPVTEVCGNVRGISESDSSDDSSEGSVVIEVFSPATSPAPNGDAASDLGKKKTYASIANETRLERQPNTDNAFGIAYKPCWESFQQGYDLPSGPAFVDEDEFEQEMGAEFRVPGFSGKSLETSTGSSDTARSGNMMMIDVADTDDFIGGNKEHTATGHQQASLFEKNLLDERYKGFAHECHLEPTLMLIMSKCPRPPCVAVILDKIRHRRPALKGFSRPEKRAFTAVLFLLIRFGLLNFAANYSVHTLIRLFLPPVCAFFFSGNASCLPFCPFCSVTMQSPERALQIPESVQGDRLLSTSVDDDNACRSGSNLPDNAGVTPPSPHDLELDNQDALKQITEQYKQVGSASPVRRVYHTASSQSTPTCMPRR